MCASQRPVPTRSYRCFSARSPHGRNTFSSGRGLRGSSLQLSFLVCVGDFWGGPPDPRSRERSVIKAVGKPSAPGPAQGWHRAPSAWAAGTARARCFVSGGDPPVEAFSWCRGWPFPPLITDSCCRPRGPWIPGTSLCPWQFAPASQSGCATVPCRDRRVLGLVAMPHAHQEGVGRFMTRGEPGGPDKETSLGLSWGQGARRAWLDPHSSPDRGSPQASLAAGAGMGYKGRRGFRVVSSQTLDTGSDSWSRAAQIQVPAIPAHTRPFSLDVELGRKPIPTRLSPLPLEAASPSQNLGSLRRDQTCGCCTPGTGVRGELGS